LNAKSSDSIWCYELVFRETDGKVFEIGYMCDDIQTDPKKIFIVKMISVLRRSKLIEIKLEKIFLHPAIEMKIEEGRNRLG